MKIEAKALSKYTCSFVTYKDTATVVFSLLHFLNVYLYIIVDNIIENIANSVGTVLNRIRSTCFIISDVYILHQNRIILFLHPSCQFVNERIVDIAVLQAEKIEIKVLLKFTCFLSHINTSRP